MMRGHTVKNGDFSDSEEDANRRDCSLFSIDIRLPKLAVIDLVPRVLL